MNRKVHPFLPLTEQLQLLTLALFRTAIIIAFHEIFLKKIFKIIFFRFLDYFDIMKSKINFKNKKDIILIYLQIKITLKSNMECTLTQARYPSLPFAFY